jgi:hypothetical protein
VRVTRFICLADMLDHVSCSSQENSIVIRKKKASRYYYVTCYLSRLPQNQYSYTIQQSFLNKATQETRYDAAETCLSVLILCTADDLLPDLETLDTIDIPSL